LPALLKGELYAYMLLVNMIVYVKVTLMKQDFNGCNVCGYYNVTTYVSTGVVSKTFTAKLMSFWIFLSNLDWSILLVQALNI